MAVQYTPIPEFQVPNVNFLGALAQGEASRLQEIQAAKAAQAMELQGRAAQRQEEESALNAKAKLEELNQKIRALAMSRLSAVPEGDQEGYLKTIGEFKDIFPSEYDVLSKRKWDADTRRMVLLTPEQQYKQTTKDVLLPSGETQTMRYPEFGGGAAAPVNALRSAAQLEPIEDANKNILGYRVKGTGITKTPEEAAQYNYTMAREGTGKNPRSSAQGIGQFIDSTFVDTYRKTFPDRARSMSPSQILAQRGTTVDGVPVEEPMLQAFTAANQQRLRDAGFAPSKGNTYLAHFAGPEGAIDVLSASPDTPVTELLSPKAIKANPEVFSKVKTAGDLIRWAGGAGGAAANAPAKTFEPTNMKPLGTVKRASQEASLNILNDLDFDPSGQDRVSKMISASTSGPIETAGSQIFRALGATTPGREAIAGLEVLAGEYTLEKIGGKLGAGISNEDRAFISKTMGDISNPLIPAPERLRAWNEVKRRLANYADVKLPAVAAAGRGKAGEMPSEQPKAPLTAPKVGDVRRGYVFKGGNPASPSSWEKQ